MSNVAIPNPEDDSPIGPWGPWIRQDLASVMVANVVAAGVLAAATLKAAAASIADRAIAASVSSAGSELMDEYCGTVWPKRGPWPHPHVSVILAELAGNVKNAGLQKDLLGGAGKSYQSASPIA